MKNELLETYIKDNQLSKFKKEYISDVAITLTDGKKEMNLIQCFNYVMVSIDDDFRHTFEKRKMMGGSYWIVVS